MIIEYKPIGIVHSPYKSLKDVPKQPQVTKKSQCYAEVFAEYAEGLKGIEKHSQIVLICHFHLSKKSLLSVKPHNSDEIQGVFAIRSPLRPNAIGVSVVKLIKVEGRRLYIYDIDMIDGTPLLDIKPWMKDSHTDDPGR